MSKEEILKKHLSFQGETDDKWWLQSSIKHYLETGNMSGSLHSAVSSAMDEYAAQKDKEIERLKRVVEVAYISGRNDERAKIKSDTPYTDGWQQFKTDNNL